MFHQISPNAERHKSTNAGEWTHMGANLFHLLELQLEVTLYFLSNFCGGDGTTEPWQKPSSVPLNADWVPSKLSLSPATFAPEAQGKSDAHCEAPCQAWQTRRSVALKAARFPKTYFNLMMQRKPGLSLELTVWLFPFLKQFQLSTAGLALHKWCHIQAWCLLGVFTRCCERLASASSEP